MQSLVRHTKSPSANHCVILVHGFTGNSKTFSHGKRKIFELVDKYIKAECDFCSFMYHTWLWDFKLLRKGLKLVPLLGRLVPEQSNREIARYAALLTTHYANELKSYKTVNFICHSMGGIIVKRLIINELTEQRVFDGFYITLATPHRGVEAASSLGFLSNRQIDSLRPFSGEIQTLAKIWSEVSGDIKAKYYRGIDDDIVDVISSCPLNEEHRVMDVDGTHSTMSKPASPDSALIRHLNATIRGFIESPARTSGKLYTESLEEKVLFLSYKDELEGYYFQRAIDSRIKSELLHSNMWISGGSGTGKTVAIQRGIVLSGHPYMYIDLSGCFINATVAEICDNIYSQMHAIGHKRGYIKKPIKANNGPFIAQVSELLANLSFNGVCYIAIDEVAITSPSMLESFASNVIALVNYQANQNLDTRFRFIVSTMESPVGKMSAVYEGKFPAYFTHAKLDYWTEPETMGLLDMIDDALNLSLSDEDKKQIVVSSGGSPRKLKNIVKRYLSFTSGPSNSIASAIRAATLEEIV